MGRNTWLRAFLSFFLIGEWGRRNCERKQNNQLSAIFNHAECYDLSSNLMTEAVVAEGKSSAVF
ncbi:MAG: hypothetical protein HFG94_12060 [Dorea sp.]|nr:hypothetical protein [Dorea sp.]